LDALALSTCFSFSCSSFLVPCYVPSSPNAVRMLHNTSPVADLFKLSHDSPEKIMTVRWNRVLDSAEGSSAKFPVSSQDQPGDEPSKVRGTSASCENVQTKKENEQDHYL